MSNKNIFQQWFYGLVRLRRDANSRFVARVVTQRLFAREYSRAIYYAIRHSGAMDDDAETRVLFDLFLEEEEILCASELMDRGDRCGRKRKR